MGLDMYLSGNLYVKDWDHNHENGIPDDTPAKATQKACKLSLPVKSVTVEVGYWRKANQIHNWFVNNVQDGEDECKPHYVDREKLIELRQLCEDVLNDHSKAPDLLPASSGFFFGTTEYDEYYFEDLKATVLIIDEALKPENNELDFEYQSSW
jgi:hypothetical protein